MRQVMLGSTSNILISESASWVGTFSFPLVVLVEGITALEEDALAAEMDADCCIGTGIRNLRSQYGQ